MKPATIQDYTYQEQWLSTSFIEPKKKSFTEIAAECNAISVKEFFDEVRRQIKDDYDKKA